MSEEQAHASHSSVHASRLLSYGNKIGMPSVGILNQNIHRKEISDMPVVSASSTLTATPSTEPLVRSTLHPFQSYLDTHQLSWLAVAREADVRCATVWNIAHGIVVSGAQAMRVRVAIHRLSGVAYTGPMHTEAGQIPEGRDSATRSLREEVLP